MIGRILVIDASATNRITVKARLAQAHFDVTTCQTAAEARVQCRLTTPDLVFIDLNSWDDDARMFCDMLGSLPETRDVPVVAIGDLPGACLADALAKGACDLLIRPIDTPRKMARIRNLMRRRRHLQTLDRRGSSVQALQSQSAVVESITAAAMILARDMTTAQKWAGTLAPHLSTSPDPFVIDAALEMPESQGLSGPCVIVADMAGPDEALLTLTALKSAQEDSCMTYLVILPERGRDLVSTAFDMGADDVAFLGDAPGEIAARLCQLSRLQTRIRGLEAVVDDGLRMAVSDPLTGLHNRRYADHGL